METTKEVTTVINKDSLNNDDYLNKVIEDLKNELPDENEYNSFNVRVNKHFSETEMEIGLKGYYR